MKYMFKKLFKTVLFGSFLMILGLSACKQNVTSNNNSSNRNPHAANLLAVGKSAHDLLSADTYTSLKVELQYASGYKPTQGAIDTLRAFLNRRLNKPGGITITTDAIADPGQSSYSLNQISQIEINNRKAYNSGKTIAVYYFFADGNYSGNTNNSEVLGLSYRNTSIVIFEKTIQGLSGGLGQPSRTDLEATVMEHEFGHIMGLVNLGTPMVVNHADPNHPHHCEDSKCLMYYNVSTSDVVSNILNGGGIPKLDQNCLNDLKHNGGK